MSHENVEFDWVGFYKAFADELIKYKDNRKDLVKRVGEIFDELEKKNKEIEDSTDTPKMKREKIKKFEMNKPDYFKNLKDIDPFTIFGLFNGRWSDEDKRKEIIKTIVEIFFNKI